MKPTTHAEPETELDEARWSMVRDAVDEVPGAGAELGVCELCLEDARLLRQVDSFLRRVVESNRHALSLAAATGDERALLGAAWSALEPARCVGYVDGSYRVALTGGPIVTYDVTERDGALLARYEEYLARTMQEAA